MNDPLREKLTWFRNNLDLLIEDHELEKERIPVDLYFDTLDVTHAVLGVESYFVAGAFDVKEVFQAPMGRPLRDRTLVLCLAFSGRLGAIKLLPPHQAEFLASLNKDFGLHIDLTPNQMVRQFLDSVNRTESIKKEASILREADEEKTLEYVRQHAGSAKNFFKILQLVRGVTWQERLVKMRRDKNLRLPLHDVDYKEVVDSIIFQKLYRAFDDIRKHKLSANFADAVALTMLAKQAEKITADKPNSVPRFHVSAERTEDTPLFFTVLERTGLMDNFRYRLFDRPLSSILRQSDYFVFKSTFQRSPIYKSDGSGTAEMTRPKELLRLRDDISTILDTPSFIKPEQVEEIKFEGKKLNQVIDDLNTFLFFTNVWLPSSKPDVELVVRDLEEAADELRSRGFKRGVSEGIEKARKTLQENVIRYQLIRRMWLGVESATKSISQQGIPANIDYSRDFGLLRFAFPDSAYKQINQILEDLLRGSDDQGQLAHSNLIAACYMAHRLPHNNRKYVDDLAAAASLLWVAEMYRELVDLLSEVKPLPHYSLELIYTAAMSEMRHKQTQGTRILNKLYRKYSKATNKREKANLAVGVAYLYFHFWRMDHDPAWESNGDTPRRASIGHELVSRSIKLALEAYTLLGDWDMKKKVYALNQYVYYLVMGGDEASLGSMHDAANILLKYKEQGDKEWWQHRFDDTLARYYYRLACSAADAKRWNEYMVTALQYAEEAHGRAPWDKVARTFRDRVRNRKDKGFSKEEAAA